LPLFIIRSYKTFVPESDPYPVDALPTCHHALSVCKQDQVNLFDHVI
jgi:hypothetical protein